MTFWQFDHVYSEHTALIDATSDNEITYRQLDELVSRICEQLPSGRECVLLPMSYNLASIAAYLACLRKGHVAILCSDDKDTQKRLKTIYRPNIIIHTFDGECLIERNEVAAIMLHGELSICLSTSGSTGSPKLVRLSKKNVYSNALSIQQYLNIGHADRAISTLPFSYSYGLSIVNSYLLAGASLVLTSAGIMEKPFWKYMKQYHVTSLSGVPYTYQMLDRLRFERMVLPDLSTLTQAGGKLSPELIKKFQAISLDHGYQFCVMYGQTEATARIAYMPPRDLSDHPNSIGKAIPGGRLSLMDEGGNTITTTERVGQLVYEGDNVMMGYAEARNDLALGDQLNGRLLTGDLAKKISNDYYAIEGRLKRFIKIHGNRINLDDVERVLQNAGYQVVCTGSDDHLAVITPQVENVEKIKKEIGNALKLHHTVYSIEFMRELPMTQSGKVNYHQLREAFA
ncbi:MAG: AMP-binding protein [Coxiellaceae bacterium]|nr:AMP-binding protein [Coxiellaceae bacterium]